MGDNADWPHPCFTPAAARLACGAAVVCGALFIAFPAIDLGAAALFHDPVQAYPWPWTTETTRSIRKVLMLAPFVFIIPLLLSLLLKLLWPVNRMLTEPRATLTALLSCALAPGLIVNAILKEYWDRPRPYQTDAFGGSAPYQPPILPGEGCVTNCSFVSGEAAAAFWLMSLSLFVPPRWRMRAFWAAIALGLVVGGLRMAFGRHYMSDIIYAGFVSYFTVFGCVWLFWRSRWAQAA